MRYPAECPVFEVATINDEDRCIRRGAIVVGVGDEMPSTGIRELPGWLVIATTDDGDVKQSAIDRAKETGHDKFRDQFGCWMISHATDRLRPITRAARDMLAMVRE